MLCKHCHQLTLSSVQESYSVQLSISICIQYTVGWYALQTLSLMNIIQCPYQYSYCIGCYALGRVTTKLQQTQSPYNAALGLIKVGIKI